MHGAGPEPGASASDRAFGPGTKLKVTADALNVRATPDKSSGDNVLGGLHHGQHVESTGLEGGWVRIAFRGQSAYVSSQYLVEDKPAAAEHAPDPAAIAVAEPHIAAAHAVAPEHHDEPEHAEVAEHLPPPQGTSASPALGSPWMARMIREPGREPSSNGYVSRAAEAGGTAAHPCSARRPRRTT